MAKPSYTEADQERLAQAWIDSGLPITVWCAGEDDGVKRPNIQTFRKWPAVAAENERRAKEKGSRSFYPATSTRHSSAQASPKSAISPLRVQFEEEYEANKDAAYAVWLQNNQEAIKEQFVKKAEAELAAEIEKLTKPQSKEGELLPPEKAKDDGKRSRHLTDVRDLDRHKR
ncbi:hypothetical protein V2J82_13210 [Pseudomonas alliivorans]|nr:hypothetical protein [Pseudomonas alliivorans]